MRRRPGRPRSETGSKEAILAAARRLFGEIGYERTTIRTIARAADVDPALVHHYYGTKDDLLAAAIHLPIDPQPILDAAFANPDEAGTVLLLSLLRSWETPEVRDAMLALLRAAVTHPGAATILRNALTRDVLLPAAERIQLPNPDLRAALVGSQVVGLALARYALGIAPLANATVEQIATTVGPSLQRYLTAPELSEAWKQAAAE